MRSFREPGTRQQRFAEIVALLFKQPRSIPELRTALGLKKCSSSLYQAVRSLKDEGLLYIVRWERNRLGPWSPVYAWQPSVAELEDAPKPVSHWSVRYYGHGIGSPHSQPAEPVASVGQHTDRRAA